MIRVTGDSGVTWEFDETVVVGDLGGMGEVFYGSGPSREVAVKRIRLRAHDEEAIRRRQREVEIAHDLIDAAGTASSTDHLLLPLDVAVDGDDLFIVMPKAEKSLNSALSRDELDASERFAAVRDVVSGLEELAGIGILHRDLKPANVLSLGGKWVLADFGIARNLAEGTATFTFTGWGTAAYMAPELWELKPATVKSDLYALGVLAYETLVGRRPFIGPSDAEYRDQHLHLDAPEPMELATPLRRLVLRLLRKAPSERYQDARAVGESLDLSNRALEDDQRKLLEAALGAERRSEAQDAARRQSLTVAELRESERKQGLSDLEEMLHHARDRAAIALPEVELSNDGLQWHLAVGRVGLTVVPFRFPPEKSAADDPIVHACLVNAWGLDPCGGSRSIPVGGLLCNFVCENVDERLEWSLIRFTADPFVAGNYQFGPLDRPHGFHESVFNSERRYMRRGKTVWNKDVVPLTPQVVVEQLTHAITLCS